MTRHKRAVEIIPINTWLTLVYVGVVSTAVEIKGLFEPLVLFCVLNVYGGTLLKDNLLHPQKKFTNKDYPYFPDQEYRKEDIRHNRGVNILIGSTFLGFPLSFIWANSLLDSESIKIKIFVNLTYIIIFSVNTLGVIWLRKELLHLTKKKKERKKSLSKKRERKHYRKTKYKNPGPPRSTSGNGEVRW